MAKKKKTKKVETRGRKELAFNVKQLEQLCYLGLKIKPVAASMMMSTETLRRKIHDHCGQTFEEYRLRILNPRAKILVDRAIELALSGNSRMMEMCLTNLAGWSRNLELELNNEQKAIVLKYSLDEPKDVTPPIEAKHGDSEN
jgi:hypothetical protein